MPELPPPGSPPASPSGSGAEGPPTPGDYPPPGYQSTPDYRPPAGNFAPAGYHPPIGTPPQSLSGPFYSTGLTILFTIITLGIWGAIWTYRTKEDLKRYNGEGLGGVLGVVVYLLLSVVLMFTIPNEIEKMYQRDGRQSPISTIWGLWFLLPLIGNIIWYVKVQRSLNEFWTSKGSPA